MFAEAREKSSDQKLAAAYRQGNWIFSLSLPVSLDVVVKGQEAESLCEVKEVSLGAWGNSGIDNLSLVGFLTKITLSGTHFW